LPLTPEGEEKARSLGAKLAGHSFALILTSPMQRARRTCEIAGLGAEAQIDPNLCEWNYGSYEGLTTGDIRRQRPAWSLFRDGVPGGETIEKVAARAQAVIDRTLQASGDTALFAHGHILRILATRWLGIEPADARLFALSTASISTLGHEHETRAITRWNLT
jgi:probable phosphoglycerate mutase